MNRREALRLLAAGITLPLLPGTLLAEMRAARDVAGASPVPRTLNPHQYATVKAMADAIIPRTETPGATDVGAADFIDLMLTEWYDTSDRDRFLGGLGDVDALSKEMFGKNFIDGSSPQQGEILALLGEKMTEEAQRSRDRAAEETGSSSDSKESFYPMLRRLTLTAYYTSEAGATQELHFEIIPDRHDECAEMPSPQGGSNRP
jgi:gluconate 2-dehydrogenase gamma chain